MNKQNLLTTLHGSELNERAKERILVYGRGGCGKSRFVCSYPESWGRAVYYAADLNSWLLSSVSQKKRNRIEVVRPEGDNPCASFQKFCMMDFDELGPDIGVIIVDTYTKVALDALAYTANSLTITREPHFILGEIGEGGAAIATRSDYQGVDALSKQCLDDLFKGHPDKHIIFVMHEESKMIGGANGTLVGGPQHPGWTMIDYLPSQFGTVVRLTRDEILIPGDSDITPVVIATTEFDGKFSAKLRTNDEESPNPLAKRVLDRNPSSWWDGEFEPYLQGLLKTETDAPVKKKKKKSTLNQESV